MGVWGAVSGDAWLERGVPEVWVNIYQVQILRVLEICGRTHFTELFSLDGFLQGGKNK